MIKQHLRNAFILFTCHALAYAPLLHAGQLSLPSSDLAAPEITQKEYVDTVGPDENHEIIVTVTDNVGVKQVVLYYRVTGTESYKSIAMQKINGTDDYRVDLKAAQIESPGIEYYVQAMDHAGNTLLHGYSFSPISVKKSTESTVAEAPSSDDVPDLSEDENGDGGGSSGSSNKWLWIGLGALVVAGAASGGGSDGEPSAKLTITTTEPSN